VSAVLAGAGSQIDDVAGGAHHIGIVLDDQDGVAQVAQLFEDADEAGGVAAMQSDGRLIEDVAGSDQAEPRQWLAVCAGPRRRRAWRRDGRG